MELISSGIKELDKILEGYPKDGITTFFGPGKSGKTNLVLTAAINMVKTGKKIIIINTEGEIIMDRLMQLMGDTLSINSFIFFSPKSFEEQNKIIKKITKFSLLNIGMIIIDSANKLFRAEPNTDNKKKFEQQLTMLKEISREKKIPILLTAQVYHSYDTEEEVIFAGGIINNFSDCIIELSIMNKVRKLTLKKHNNILGERVFLFQIKEKEINPFIPQ